jgi:sodium-independent sulfate anion transporter 11
MLATLLSSLFLSLEYGILIGISTNLLFVLHAAARPPLNLEKLKSNCQDEVYSIAPSGTILFPAAEFLRNVILQCQEEGALIVFDGQRVDRMDATVAKVKSIPTNYQYRDN